METNEDTIIIPFRVSELMIGGSPFTREELFLTVKTIAQAGAFRNIPEGKQQNPLKIVMSICTELRLSTPPRWTWAEFISQLSLYGATWRTFEKYFVAYRKYNLIAYERKGEIRWIGGSKK